MSCIFKLIQDYFVTIHYIQLDTFRIVLNEQHHENTFLAHLSRRLIGELIVYPWSGVRRPSYVVHNAQTSSSQKPLGRSKPNFFVEPPWVGGTIFCSRHLGHMTKMAATPIYGKTLQKSSSPEPAGRFSRNLVCSIRDSSPS